jgi:hypothetical protein
MKLFGLVAIMIRQAISAVEKDLKSTICSGVTPAAMTTFVVLAFNPKRSAAEKARAAPKAGLFVFTRTLISYAGSVPVTADSSLG